MRAYIIKRLIFMVITLLVVTMIAYTMMRVAPGDPTRAQFIGSTDTSGIISEERKETNIEQVLREKYHLDKPIIVGYGHWLYGILTRFDFGNSIVKDPGTPVMRVIGDRLPITLRLNVIAVIIIYASAIPVGIYSALRRRTLDDRIVTVLMFILYSMPSFWVGLLLLMFFTGDLFLDIFPVAGLKPDPYLVWGQSYWFTLGQTAKHYVLPIVCMTYGGLAGLSRYMRVGILEVIRQDYIRTARAKGLSEWSVILKHVLRNSLIPMVTIFAGLLPGMIAGSIVVEYIFSIPGMGSLSIDALASRDYPLMMALFTIGSGLSLCGILISDLMYGVVDPRVSLE